MPHNTSWYQPSRQVPSVFPSEGKHPESIQPVTEGAMLWKSPWQEASLIISCWEECLESLIDLHLLFCFANISKTYGYLSPHCREFELSA